jgi:DNA polymerase III epsilon subunit family exonuclease
MFSLLDPIRQVPFAIVDVETTGASAEFGHRVIEVGIARVEGGQIVGQYEQLIDPQRRITAGVVALTGISQDMVAGKPTFAEALPHMMPLLQGAVLMGHNFGFDLSFLRREFRIAGRDMMQDFPNVHVIDTVRIARRRFGRGGNGLQRLCRRLGYEPDVAHRALPDVITTYHVFHHLMHPIGGWDSTLCDTLVQQGGPMGLMSRDPRESILPLELTEALEQRRPVMMEYLDAGEHRTQRVIDPIQIRKRNGELILIAHCHLRDDRRHFKVERIVQLTRIDVPSNPPQQGTLFPDAGV